LITDNLPRHEIH